MNEATITVRLEITGRVQGVGFRESMRAVAQALEVNGWVRNREDGSVEAIVQGAEYDVERLIAWSHNGPPGAHVKYVNAHLVEDSETFIAFARWPNV
ncbi:MAG: acylphosphatase [Betaproteobacteria bacterium]|nr:acylphosphatase [Betaproteobacteria bacterium]